MSSETSSSQGPASSKRGTGDAVLPRHRNRHAHAGHDCGADLIWCAFDIASGILRGNRRTARRLVPDAAQPLDSAGPDLVHRRHVDRHGAAHRHAPDRSFGRLDAQPRRRCRGVLQVFELAPVLGVGHPAIWIIAVVFCIVARRADRRAFNGCSSPTPKSLPSSSRWAASSPTAASPSDWRSGETVAPMDKTLNHWRRHPLGFARAVLELGHCARGMRGHHFWHRQRPPPAPALQISAAPDLGRGLSGSRGQLGRAWRDHGDELLSLAAKLIENYARDNNIPIPPGVEDRAGDAICMAGEQGGALHRRADLLHRLSDSRADRLGGRHPDDLPRHAHHVRPLRLSRPAATPKLLNLPASIPSG